MRRMSMRQRVSRFVAAAAVALVGLSGAAAAEPMRIVAIGDSLTAGYGLADPADGFVDELEAALRERGHDVEIVDAGVSGDTTTGGAARLDWALGDGADGVILELGGNDGLRGVDPAATGEALAGMLEALESRGVPVLLAGMQAPPNMGGDYGRRFNAVFPDLAARYDVVFYPFFLDGVAADPALNQDDGIHPNPEGVDVIVERILPSAEALIARIEEG